MIDSNETIMYESGRDSGYIDGFNAALELVQEKLNRCVVTGNYNSGKEYRYIPYEYYEEVINEILNN